MSNSKGGNLSQPLKKVLINVPGPENLGTYRETSTGVQMLQFKTSGYTLPAINEKIKVQKPNPHVHRVVTYKLSNVAPVNNVNADFGVTISQRVRKPGVDNDRVTDKQTPYYISKSVTSGTITDAELNAIATEIAALINADKGWGNKFDYQLPGAAVVASPVLHLDTWNAASAMTLDTLVVAAAATIAGFVANINALPGYFAWLNPAVAATEIFVTKTADAVSPGTAIVFANTAGTIDAAAAQPVGTIALVNKYVDTTFEVMFPNGQGAVTEARKGKFAFLTNAEVQQQFSHIPNLGTLAQEVRAVNQVLPGVDYVKVIFEVTQDHYALDGASHKTGFITQVEVYIPESEWNPAGGTKLRWEAESGNRIMDAGTTSNLAAVLAKWVA